MAKTNSAQSLVNNFHSTPDDKYNSSEIKFYISQLKKETGLNEQKLIIDMLFFSFRNYDKFKAYRKEIQERWEESKIECVSMEITQ